MAEEKKRRGRPKLGDQKKKPKNMKLSIQAHKQLESLSLMSGKKQAVIVEILINKASKNIKLIE